MRIYMDEEMCAELGLTYYGRNIDEQIAICPHDLIKLRGYKGYDKKHMDFFNEVGEYAILTLTNEGLGWFVVQ